MLNHVTNAMRKLTTIVAMATALGITTTSRDSRAALVTATGGLTQVEYPGFLMIQFASVNYQASLASPCGGVPAQSLDTVKLWMSLAQSSLLSGKNLAIYYADCGATHYITDLVLQK